MFFSISYFHSFRQYQVVQINKSSHRSHDFLGPTVQPLKLLVRKEAINSANNEIFDLPLSCKLMHAWHRPTSHLKAFSFVIVPILYLDVLTLKGTKIEEQKQGTELGRNEYSFSKNIHILSPCNRKNIKYFTGNEDSYYMLTINV